jgi:hypothetical protein
LPAHVAAKDSEEGSFGLFTARLVFFFVLLLLLLDNGDLDALRFVFAWVGVTTFHVITDGSCFACCLDDEFGAQKLANTKRREARVGVLGTAAIVMEVPLPLDDMTEAAAAAAVARTLVRDAAAPPTGRTRRERLGVASNPGSDSSPAIFCRQQQAPLPTPDDSYKVNHCALDCEREMQEQLWVSFRDRLFSRVECSVDFFYLICQVKLQSTVLSHEL